jgi:Zn-dependent peptidase ImmA (M78 family)
MKDPRERFADIFAGESLMPTEGIRRVMEEHGFGPRITDAADVVHLQRFFNVSYATALVRRMRLPLSFAATSGTSSESCARRNLTNLNIVMRWSARRDCR